MASLYGSVAAIAEPELALIGFPLDATWQGQRNWVESSDYPITEPWVFACFRVYLVTRGSRTAFSDFLRHRLIATDEPAFRSQFSRVCNAECDNLLVTRAFKLESLTARWPGLRRELGLPSLLLLNKNETPSRWKRSVAELFASPADLELINMNHADDFRWFEYEMAGRNPLPDHYLAATADSPWIERDGTSNLGTSGPAGPASLPETESLQPLETHFSRRQDATYQRCARKESSIDVNPTVHGIMASGNEAPMASDALIEADPATSPNTGKQPIEEPSDLIWGRGDDRTKMIQIGNNGFESTGDYEKVQQEKIEEAKLLAKKISPKLHEIGLEIGCGLGIHTSYIARRCRHVYTVDVSDQFRELFERYTVDDKNITRYQSDFFPMMADIPEHSIDFAWSVAVFCHLHVYDIYWYFMEIAKKLKPGGRFHVNWQSADTIDYGKDWFTDVALLAKEKGRFLPIWQTCIQYHSNEFFYRTADYFGLSLAQKSSHGSYAEALFVRR
jgi:SAM-dependent methyltransferase